MEDKVVVVADKYTSLGFRLAGVEEAFPLEGREAEKKVEELLGSEGVGIIVINEKLLASMDWRLKKRIESAAKPTVVAVPDKSGRAEEAESLKEMVKRALGFELLK